MFHETKRASVRLNTVLMILATTLATLTLCVSSWAQGNLGRISGVITDQSGGVIAGAKVTVLDVARGVSRALTTDNGGEYIATGLIPGQYEVTVEAMGFSKFDRQNIDVVVGAEVRVDATLNPGSQTQTVTVTEEAPNISTSNATLGGVVENRALTELPLSGRNYLHLLDDKPGVQMKPGGGSNSYVSNGQRQAANGFYFDGLYSGNINTGATPNLGGGPGVGGGIEQVSLIPVDGVQEINVMEDPKAEYGPWPGAYINIGLKSGTNAFHGTAYAFGRDQALEAKNAFLASKQPTSVEQWGGSVGGPIKKDKLFFFGNFERQVYSIAAAKGVFEPTTAAGLGSTNSFPDAIAAMNAAGVAVSPLSLALAGCTNPASHPTIGAQIPCNAANGLFGNSSSSPTNPTSEVVAFPINGFSNNVISKIDYALNAKNAIHGEFAYGGGDPLGGTGAVQPYWRGFLHMRAYVTRGMWIWTPNSTWVNEARFGYDQILQAAQPGDCTPGTLGAPNYASLGFVTGVPLCGLGAISLGSPFTNLGSNLGASSQAKYFTGEDAVTRTFGKHVIKFGAGARATDWTGGSFVAQRGTIAFKATTITGLANSTALEAFLAGIPNSTAGANSLVVGKPSEDDTWKSYWGYLQDDWRIAPRITLNLGLRYDYQAPMRDSNNNLGGFDPTSPTGLFQQSNSRSLWTPSKKDFGPRIGIAWDITGKGTTVLRAGGGVFYDPFITQLISTQATTYATPTGATLFQVNGSAIQGPGNLQNGTISLTPAQIHWALNTPIFGNLPTSPTLSCGNGIAPVNPVPGGPVTNPAPCALSVVDQGLKMQVVGEWNLGIQHAITNSITIDVSYVGNHSDYGTGARDVNQPTPGVTGTTIEQQRRPYYSQFPYLGAISTEFSDEWSNYNALQASLTKRVTHGLSLTSGYTWGHALDIHSLDGAATPKGLMDSTRPNLDYGSSDYDYRQRFTITGTYLIPGKKSPAQLLEGWQLNSALNILSGAPMEAYDSTSDLSGTAEAEDRWDLFGNPSDFKVGTPNAIPCYGVAGSSFAAKGSPCTVVASVGAMPLACTQASAALPVNLAVSGANSTGLASLQSLGCYMNNGSVIVPPAQGTYGNMARNVLRGQRLRVWDMSLAKNWKIKERVTAQFRIECFNIINAVNYAIPAPGTGTNPASPSSFGVSTGTPDVVNGAPVFGTGGPRKIQLGAKFIF
jgi:outer membrane receptor protein involved in Fe transport